MLTLQTAVSLQRKSQRSPQVVSQVATASQASAQSSRRVVDSKGGLELLSSDASQMGNYQLRTLVETWMKPVLRQTMKYEQAYETDATLFALAGRKAKARVVGICGLVENMPSGNAQRPDTIVWQYHPGVMLCWPFPPNMHHVIY